MEDPFKALEIACKFLLREWFKSGVMLRSTERDRFFNKENQQKEEIVSEIKKQNPLEDYEIVKNLYGLKD